MKKNIKKKINKLLNKKIAIKDGFVYILFIFVVFFGFVCYIKNPFRKYSYIDLDNNWGESRKCYKYKGELVCETRKKVKQYYIK